MTRSESYLRLILDDPTTYTDDTLDRADIYEFAVMAIFLDGTGSNVI